MLLESSPLPVALMHTGNAGWSWSWAWTKDVERCWSSHLHIQRQSNSLCEQAKFGFHWEYTWSLNLPAPRYHSCRLFPKSWHSHKSPAEVIPSSSSLPISPVMNEHVSFQQAGQCERGRGAVCFLLFSNEYQQPLGFYQRRMSSATSQCRLRYTHLCLYNMMYIHYTLDIWELVIPVEVYIRIFMVPRRCCQKIVTTFDLFSSATFRSNWPLEHCLAEYSESSSILGPLTLHLASPSR